MKYHIRRLTNGKPGNYLVELPSKQYSVGTWSHDINKAREYNCKEYAKECSNTINNTYKPRGIETRAEKSW